MKVVRLILVAGLLLGLTMGAAQADGKKKGNKPIKGTVSAISESSITIKPAKKDAEEVTLTINEDTKIKISGKKATAADIKEGMKVVVKYDEEVAVSITVTDKDKKKKKDKADQPAEEPKE